MAPKFGTSGLRGLVVELTEDLVKDYTRAFLAACPQGSAVMVGQDLRPSSPEIAGWVMQAVVERGLTPIDAGVLPTPALALAAMGQGISAVMITGSHIPADRNGLKFYVPLGEISKDDEQAILSHLGMAQGDAAATPLTCDALGAYARRYIEAFGPALKGLRIGVYQHSSVARDVMVEVLEALGATPVPLNRTDHFVPVDTEALDPQTTAMLAGWAAAHDLDAVVSTDGDADRPMLADATGRVIPGDVLGALTARWLGAAHLVTPVNSNTMIDAMSGFARITRTRIGSPYVIAGMEAALRADPDAQVVGYEANGGFLLGYAARGLAPLMTRDCLLPILAPLAEARARGQSVADLAASLPPRFTAADRLQGVEPEAARGFIATLADPAARAEFFDGMGREEGKDETDGLRLRFEAGEILHLRPSGNAPEFRCYSEADSAARAQDLVTLYLKKLGAALL
ncbi:MAG: phosphomannomutase [Pelagimonas sp.]|jgi:phosphomannomutase|nr:phosphomannomutase [Pelagimonas sp.]